MSKYDMLLQYFYAESVRLSDDVSELQDNVRYRHISTVDCLELIIAKERYSAFMEFQNNVCQLLHIGMHYEHDKKKEVK